MIEKADDAGGLHEKICFQVFFVVDFFGAYTQIVRRRKRRVFRGRRRGFTHFLNNIVIVVVAQTNYLSSISFSCVLSRLLHLVLQVFQ